MVKECVDRRRYLDEERQPRTMARTNTLTPYCIPLIIGLLLCGFGRADALYEDGDAQRISENGQQEMVMYGKSQTSYGNETYAKLSDIWLCLACALGWTVWLVSNTKGPLQTNSSDCVFDQQACRKVMGHVLQVSVGEDADGTGIPVYNALIDYVVDAGEEEPLQVRKCFQTQKLLEEGFANVEVLVLTDDPRTSILFDDYILDKKHQFSAQPSMVWIAGMYLVSLLLIGTSIVGGLHALRKLEPSQKAYGWVLLVVGSAFLYPTAIFLYQIFCGWFAWLADRPGVIVHGAARRLDQCGALEVFQDQSCPCVGSDPRENPTSPRLATASTVELSNVQNPFSSTLYPNAGCDAGNYNVHMLRGQSSLSSMSSVRTNTTRSSTSLLMPQLQDTVLKHYERTVKPQQEISVPNEGYDTSAGSEKEEEGPPLKVADC